MQPDRRRAIQGPFEALIVFAVLVLASATSWVQESDADEAPADSTEQRDVFDVVRSLLNRNVPDPSLEGELRSGLAWTLLPSFSYNPVYGFAFGASASGTGRLGLRSENHYSRLWAGANYSTTGQLQAEARGDLFLSDDALLVMLDGRYLDTSRSTYGLGSMYGDEQEYPMDYRLLRGHVRFLWHLEAAVYAGVGYHYDQYLDILDDRANAGESTPYLEYTGELRGRSISSGASINLLADSRDNPANPRRGYYISSSFRSFTKTLGSDDNWQELRMEFRAYPHVPRGSRHRLAFWIMNWFTFGDAPYLNLPYIGGDVYGRTGRGFLQGRIRSADLVYLEGEYRFDLRKDGLLGAVAFLNATSVTDPESGVFDRVNWGKGVGLRVKFNKKSDTNLTVDKGWGSYGSSGFFVGLSEAY